MPPEQNQPQPQQPITPTELRPNTEVADQQTKEGQQFIKQGTEGLEKARKSGDTGAGLIAVAFIVAGLFALRRGRNAANTQDPLAATGGFDARTVDNPQTTLTEIDGQRKTNTDQTQELQKRIEGIQTQLKSQPNTGSLQTELGGLQQDLVKLSTEGAHFAARIAHVKIEQGRRLGLVEQANKGMNGNPNSLGQSMTLNGNQLTITFRRPLTQEDRARLQKVTEQFGGYGVNITTGENGGTMTMTVPASFWSEWSTGMASTGRGARIAIIGWLMGSPESEAKQKEQKINTEPQTKKIEAGNKAQKQTFEKGTQAGNKTRAGNQTNIKQEQIKKNPVNIAQAKKDASTKKEQVAGKRVNDALRKKQISEMTPVIEQLVSGTTTYIAITRIDDARDRCREMIDAARKTRDQLQKQRDAIVKGYNRMQEDLNNVIRANTSHLRVNGWQPSVQAEFNEKQAEMERKIAAERKLQGPVEEELSTASARLKELESAMWNIENEMERRDRDAAFDKKKQEYEKKLPPAEIARKQELSAFTPVINRLVAGQENVRDIVRIDDVLAQWNIMNRAQGSFAYPHDLVNEESRLHSISYQLELQLKGESDTQALRWERELQGVSEKAQKQRFAELRAKHQKARSAEDQATRNVQEWWKKNNSVGALGKQLMDEMNRRDVLAGMQPRGVTPDFSGSVWPANERRTVEGGLRIPITDTAVTKIALGELVSLGITSGSGYITTGALPVSAWRDSPAGSGLSVGMIRSLLSNRQLVPEEQAAMIAAAPNTMAAFRFNQNVQSAQLVLDSNEPAIKLKMEPNHPHFAETRKAFVATVQPILAVLSESGSTFRFGPFLANAQVLNRLTDAIDNGRREIPAEQADREGLMMLVDALPMRSSDRRCTRERLQSLSNGIIIEEIIYSFQRTSTNRDFRSSTRLYCDEDGNLRENTYNITGTGRIVVANWTTVFRTAPAAGTAMLAAGLSSMRDSYNQLQVNLEAHSTMTRVRLMNESAQEEEVRRRSGEIGVGGLYVHVEGILLNRIKSLEAISRQRDDITWSERVSEYYATAGAATWLDVAHAAGLDLSSVDIRPSAQIRAARQMAVKGLKETQALYNEFIASQSFGPTNRNFAAQTKELQNFAQRIPNMDYTQFNRRLRLCQQICEYAEVGLEYVDLGAETLAGTLVPYAGAPFYRAIRDGVGIVAGEEVRVTNSDGSVTRRRKDWGDFAINVGISAIPIPGSRGTRMIMNNPLARTGTRWALRLASRHLIASARRAVIEGILNEAKYRFKSHLEEIAKAFREGRSLDDIWQNVAVQEPDYVGFIMSAGVRIVAQVGGDQAGKGVGEYANKIGGRLMRSELPVLQKMLSQRASQGAKMAGERGIKFSAEQLTKSTDELVKTITDDEMQQND